MELSDPALNELNLEMTSQSDPVRPAVFIPERFEPLMTLVRRTGRSNQAVFPAAFDLLCFAAAIGFTRNEQGAIAVNSNDKTSGGEVVMNVPDRKDRLLCDMIAVADAGDDSVLEVGKLQERLDTFMRYACGGLDHLMVLTKTRTARDAVEAVIRGADQDSSVADLRDLVDLDGDA